MRTAFLTLDLIVAIRIAGCLPQRYGLAGRNFITESRNIVSKLQIAAFFLHARVRPARKSGGKTSGRRAEIF